VCKLPRNAVYVRFIVRERLCRHVAYTPCVWYPCLTLTLVILLLLYVVGYRWHFKPHTAPLPASTLQVTVIKVLERPTCVQYLGARACGCAGKAIKTRQTIENIYTGHLLSQRHTIPRIHPVQCARPKHKHKHHWRPGGKTNQTDNSEQQEATDHRPCSPIAHRPLPMFPHPVCHLDPLMDATR